MPGVKRDEIRPSLTGILGNAEKYAYAHTTVTLTVTQSADTITIASRNRIDPASTDAAELSSGQGLEFMQRAIDKAGSTLTYGANAAGDVWSISARAPLN